MIYFDNAATTYPKPERVIKSVTECIRNYCANAGRSSHDNAVKCAEKIYEARESIARHFNFGKPENVVFTENATYALNIAIKTLIPKNSHVIISNLEHNSVLRPIIKLANDGYLTYSVYNALTDIEKNIKCLIKADTRAIISTLASNVSGFEIPISILSRVARENSLLFIADGSQLAGHKRIDLGKNPCDAFCAPGHKGLFGIQGAGFICFAGETLPTKSFIEGGSGFHSKLPTMPNELPELLEGGTLPTPAIVSLNEGISFIEDVTPDAIAEKITFLRSSLVERLENLKKIKIISASSAIVSLTQDSGEISKIDALLAREKIAIRSGLHCAPLAHNAYGTIEHGCVRISLSYFNSIDEVDALYSLLKHNYV